MRLDLAVSNVSVHCKSEVTTFWPKSKDTELPTEQDLPIYQNF